MRLGLFPSVYPIHVQRMNDAPYILDFSESMVFCFNPRDMNLSRPVFCTGRGYFVGLPATEYVFIYSVRDFS